MEPEPRSIEANSPARAASTGRHGTGIDSGIGANTLLNASSKESFPSASPLPAITAVRSHRLGRRVLVGLMLASIGVAGLALGSLTRTTQVHAADLRDAPRTEGRRILFSPRYAHRHGFKFHEVGEDDVVPILGVTGTVTFDPEFVASVGVRLRGIVRNVNRFEGAQVKAGEVLASIDSPELGQAQAAVAVLRAENRAAHLADERERQLAARGLTTLREVEEAESSSNHYQALLGAARQRVAALNGVRSARVPSRNLGIHTVASPIGGTIVERNLSRGQLVEANHVAFVIADLDHVWVELSVYERKLPTIRVGDPVELREATKSDQPICEGRVVQVAPVLDQETRSATVRVQVDNRQRRLKPGQSVSARVRATGATLEDVVTIPSPAIIYVDGKASVFVAESPTTVHVTPVELGATNGQRIQVKSGLSTGMRVLVRGVSELRDQLFR